MSLKSIIAKPYARAVTKAVMARAMDPVNTQAALLRELIRFGGDTTFGREHRLHAVRDHAELVQAVPLRDYEAFKPYIERIGFGEEDVLWPGKPLYF